MVAAISGEPPRKRRTSDHWSRGWPERTTDANGSVLIPGLTNYVPVAVGIDSSSLADPTLAPKNSLQVVTAPPRRTLPMWKSAWLGQATSKAA